MQALHRWLPFRVHVRGLTSAKQSRHDEQQRDHDRRAREFQRPTLADGGAQPRHTLANDGGREARLSSDLLELLSSSFTCNPAQG